MFLVLTGLLLAACGEEASTMRITSPAFNHGARIPRQFTGEGNDIAPPLTWQQVPATAKELALICDDPDAPTPKPWVHWVVYRISGRARGMEGGNVSGGLQGVNDFGKQGYGGPMPPKGHGTHHYDFHLYALDTEIGLAAGATKEELLAAMEGHVIAHAKITGTYERK